MTRSLALGVGLWSLSGLISGCIQAPVKPAHVPRGDSTPVTNYIRALTLKEMSTRQQLVPGIISSNTLPLRTHPHEPPRA